MTHARSLSLPVVQGLDQRAFKTRSFRRRTRTANRVMGWVREAAQRCLKLALGGGGGVVSIAKSNTRMPEARDAKHYLGTLNYLWVLILWEREPTGSQHR